MRTSTARQDRIVTCAEQAAELTAAAYRETFDRELSPASRDELVTAIWEVLLAAAPTTDSCARGRSRPPS